MAYVISRRLAGLAPVILWGSLAAISAQADTFDDKFTEMNGGVTLSVNGTIFFTAAQCSAGFGPEACGTTFFLTVAGTGVGEILQTPLQSFNIYDDPAQTILSDTLSLKNAGTDPTSGATRVSVLFQSDIPGVTLMPLAGGTAITETGGVQQPITLAFETPDRLNSATVGIQFQSDTPEPASVILLCTLLGSLGLRRLRGYWRGTV